MDQPSQESNSLSLSDAASLLVESRSEEAQPQEATQPEEAVTEEDQVMPSEAEADEDSNYELSEAEAEEEDHASEDDDVEEDYEEHEVYTVKVNGQDVDVTLEEALKGYQREADYTQKTQQLGEERKSLEAEKNQFEQTRAETARLRDAYSQSLEQLSQHLQAGLAQEPNWDQAYEQLDAKEYARLVQDWQTRKENAQKVQIEQARVSKERAAETENLMRRHLAQQSDLMLEKLPQWRDEKTRETEREGLIKHAKTLGYTDDEIANAADHRAIVALYHSWQLSKLNASTPDAKKKVRRAPKMAKAGVPRSKNEVANKRRQKLRERHAAEGSIQSAVDLLLNR